MVARGHSKYTPGLSTVVRGFRPWDVEVQDKALVTI